jgi:hypothetical protein
MIRRQARPWRPIAGRMSPFIGVNADSARGAVNKKATAQLFLGQK